MVFPPYRLFCFLLLKQAGIPTLQANFVYNQMVGHGKYLSMISFLPTQCMIFSTRFVVQSVKDFHQCKCKPIRKAATSTKSKAVQFSPIPLDVYFFPTQTARLPHGVFSTRICASNRSANADTWEIIPTMQS